MNRDVCDRCFKAAYDFIKDFERMSDIETLRSGVRKGNFVLTQHDGSPKGRMIKITHACPMESLQLNSKLTYAEKDKLITKHRLDSRNSTRNYTISVLAIYNALYIPEWCIFDKFHDLNFKEVTNNGISL